MVINIFKYILYVEYEVCCGLTRSVIILIVVVILIIVPEDVVQQLLALLTDDGLLVSALDIVPLDPIIVNIVEDADAGLLLASLLLFPVVWLRLTSPSRLAPLTVAALPGSRDPLTCGRPVPTVLYGRLEVLTVAAFEVTFPSTSPDIVKILIVNQVLHPPGLGRCLDGDGVHAELPAVVPGALPVPLGVPADREPGEMVVLVKPGLVYDSVLTGGLVRQPEYLCQAGGEERGEEQQRGEHPGPVGSGAVGHGLN